VELPLETQQHCQQFLEKIRQDPNYQFSAVDRFEIYKSFGISRFSRPGFNSQRTSDVNEFHQFIINEFKFATLADYTLGWLGYLTGQKVITLCLQNNPDDNIPRRIIQTLENVLQNRMTVENTCNLLYQDYYYGTNVERKTTFGVWCAYCAIYAALELVLADSSFYFETYSKDNDGNEGLSRDFASLALRAYSAIDNNPPGAWFREKIGTPIEFDSQKRLEFWEWWLTEAIPQAWDLAHEPKTNT